MPEISIVQIINILAHLQVFLLLLKKTFHILLPLLHLAAIALLLVLFFECVCLLLLLIRTFYASFFEKQLFYPKFPNCFDCFP